MAARNEEASGNADAAISSVLPHLPNINYLKEHQRTTLKILEEIFLNIPPNMVVCVCRLVCHEWKEVADRQSFWREKCRRVGYSLGEIYKSPDNWRMFYFLLKKKRNLIENPRGEVETHGGKNYPQKTTLVPGNGSQC
uniref:F-box domain-containing protein n=1 Tax=Fundulus heteroclitus TaxID=8078 RepID=A0A3Q2PZV7_FUNHE